MKDNQLSLEFFIKNKVTKEEAEKFANMIQNIHKEVVESTNEPKGERPGISLIIGATRICAIRKKFSDPFLIVAFIYREIAQNHYFTEGNKRTAHGFAKSELFFRGYHLKIRYKYAVPFIEKIASKGVSQSEIIAWLKRNSIKYHEKSAERYLKEIIKEINIDEKRGRPKHEQ